MKALPIISKNPEEYKRHVVTPGPFHTAMNYLGMITGHKWHGSGYSELLVESKLAASGCLTGVLSGKAYVKAIFDFQTVFKASQHLLMEKFIEEVNEEKHNPKSLTYLVLDCSR